MELKNVVSACFQKESTSNQKTINHHYRGSVLEIKFSEHRCTLFPILDPHFAYSHDFFCLLLYRTLD